MLSAARALRRSMRQNDGPSGGASSSRGRGDEANVLASLRRTLHALEAMPEGKHDAVEGETELFEAYALCQGIMHTLDGERVMPEDLTAAAGERLTRRKTCSQPPPGPALGSKVTRMPEDDEEPEAFSPSRRRSSFRRLSRSGTRECAAAAAAATAFAAKEFAQLSARQAQEQTAETQPSQSEDGGAAGETDEKCDGNGEVEGETTEKEGAEEGAEEKEEKEETEESGEVAVEEESGEEEEGEEEEEEEEESDVEDESGNGGLPQLPPPPSAPPMPPAPPGLPPGAPMPPMPPAPAGLPPGAPPMPPAPRGPAAAETADEPLMVSIPNPALLTAGALGAKARAMKSRAEAANMKRREAAAAATAGCGTRAGAADVSAAGVRAETQVL